MTATPGAGRRGGPGRSVLLIGIPLVVVAALVFAIFAIAAQQRSAQRSSAETAQFRQAAENPDVAPGTKLPGVPAPDFTLTDQFGRRVSLRQFRGKVLVIAFVDARCTTVCPLTTVS